MASNKESDSEEDIFFSEEDYEAMSCTHYNLLKAFYECQNKNASIKEENSPTQKTNMTSGNAGNPLNESSVAQRPTLLASLSQFEHSLYLELKKKYPSNGKSAETAAELQDMKVLEDLEQKVAEERKRVNDYLHYNACGVRRKEYFVIDKDAKQFVTEVIKQELQYCLSYPRWYVVHKVLPGLVSATQVEAIPFTFIKVVLKLGQAPHFAGPNTSHKFKMFMPYDALMKKYCPAAISDPDTHPAKLHISRDRIAYDLAAKYQADVVITLESLKILVDNVFPSLEHDWEIPIIVSDGLGVSGKTCKRIFVEKALPRSSMTVRDKNELYMTYVVKQKFTYLDRPKSRKFLSKFANLTLPENIKPISKEVQAEVRRKISSLSPFDDLCEYSEKVCELDTFGISAPNKPAAQSKVAVQKSTVLPKEENDIKVAGMSSLGSDDDLGTTGEPEELINVVKGLLMSVNPKTAAKSEDSENLSMMESHNSTRCMSLSSNADSECDDLVIDSGGEEWQPKKAAAAASSHIGDKQHLDGIHEKMMYNVKGKQEAQPQQGEANNAAREDDIKLVIKKSHVQRLSYPPLPVNVSSKNPLDEILMSQHKMLKPKEKIYDTEELVPPQFAVKQPIDPMAQLAEGYPSLDPGDNVQYSLWRLSGLKVLLRSELDSQTTPPGLSTVPAFLFPKLEYQMKFGCEISTVSELLQQWIILHTHPNSRLLKVRIDVATKLIAMLDEMKLPDVVRTVGKNEITRATQQLYVILNSLITLREGQYLLVHKKGEQVFTLREAVNSEKSSSAFDLHADIHERLAEADSTEEPDSTAAKVQWLPIDPSVTLPDHVQQNRIPGCFFPKGWNFKKWKAKENKGESNSAVSKKGKDSRRFRHKGQKQSHRQQQKRKH